MIHEVKLPEETRKRLTDIVYLQMWLLRYASSTSTIDRAGCEKYLQRHPRFRGRHTEITKWLFRGPKRLELLEQFALGSKSEKRRWSRILSKEVFILLNRSFGEITPYYETNSTPDWKKSGADFLRRFYEEMDDGLKSYFFSDPKATKFNRKDFNKNFGKQNKHLLVCPACDFTSEDTQVDHYLPRSLYPHLSCHPFNLVPICINCNSPKKKGNKDLLQPKVGRRRRLQDIVIPYKKDGFKNNTYLDISLTSSYKQAAGMMLKPIQNHGYGINKSIEAYNEVFSIPDRWLNKQEIIHNEIFDQIKRSIKGERRKNKFPTINDLSYIFEILYEDIEESQGRKELAFAMTWWLKTIIDHEIQPAIESSYPIKSEDFPLIAELLPDVFGNNEFTTEQQIERTSHELNSHEEEFKSQLDSVEGKKNSR